MKNMCWFDDQTRVYVKYSVTVYVKNLASPLRCHHPRRFRTLPNAGYGWACIAGSMALVTRKSHSKSSSLIFSFHTHLLTCTDRYLNSYMYVYIYIYKQFHGTSIFQWGWWDLFVRVLHKRPDGVIWRYCASYTYIYIYTHACSITSYNHCGWENYFLRKAFLIVQQTP